MTSVHQTPRFVEWFFGKEVADRLDAIKAADPEPRPTAFEGFIPSATEDAFFAGYTLGLAGEPAEPPADYSRRRALSFRAGWVAGDRQAEKDALAAMLDRRERFESIMADSFEVRDADIYPYGGVS
jgi:hypothetical protein